VPVVISAPVVAVVSLVMVSPVIGCGQVC